MARVKRGVIAGRRHKKVLAKAKALALVAACSSSSVGQDASAPASTSTSAAMRDFIRRPPRRKARAW